MAAQIRLKLRLRRGRGPVAVTEHPGQADPGLGLAGHGMDLLVLVELQPVLYGSQKS